MQIEDLPLPASQSAIVTGEDGELTIRQDVPLPKVHPGHVLVHVRTTALNPVDTKMIGALATPGATSGFDFAGTVIAQASPVPDGQSWSPGTLVCGAVNGQNAFNLREGAFAQYITVPPHALLRVPDTITIDSAATLGVGIGTIGLVLFRSLQLPETPQTVLVYGGSSATGTLALQLLKIYGHHPITTCSQHNFDLVKSYGAEMAFDYHSAAAMADIRAYTNNKLKFIMDCITTAETIEFCQACMGRFGGSYTTTEPIPDRLIARRRIKHDWVLQPEVLGKPIGWPAPFGRENGSPEMLTWATRWYQTVQDLLDRGQLRPHPAQVQSGGLHGILRDMDLLLKRKISGAKLVYRLD